MRARIFNRVVGLAALAGALLVAGAAPASAEKRIALGKGTQIEPPGRTGCRPEAADDVVQVRAPNARGALDQLQPIRGEHAHERPGLGIRRALSAHAVDAEDLGTAALDAGLDHVRLWRRRQSHARNTLAASDQVSLA